MAVLSAPLEVPAADRWLYGRWLDLLVGCGLGYVLLVPALLSYGYATSVQSWSVGATAAFGILINTPHYGATVLRVYGSRDDRAKYRLFALYATVGLAILFAVASRSVWLASALFTIYVTWSPWHFAGQNYGLALMFLRRRGVEVDAQAKRFFYLSFLLSAALAMLAIHGRSAAFSVAPPALEAPGAPKLIALGVPEPALPWLFAGTGAAYLVCLAAAAWRLRRTGSLSDHAPAWILVATQALWYAVPVLFASGNELLLPFSAVWVSTAHSLQYLWITGYYAKRSPARENAGRFLFKAMAAGTAVTVLPTVLFAPDLLGRLPWDAGLATTAFAVINIHHFILDGAIWKLRDGAIARVLLRPSAVPTAPEHARSRGSWIGALVWSAAVLSLVVPATSIYEAIGTFRDPSPARASQAAWRLRWVARETVSLHLEVGKSNELHGLDEAAIAHYRRSLDLFPTPEAWDALGGIYARHEQLGLALDAYDQAAALQPQSARFLFRRAQLALALAEKGERPDPGLRQTTSSLRQVLELEPSHAPASLLLAQLAVGAGLRDDAVRILERAIAQAADAPSPRLRQRLAELRQHDPPVVSQEPAVGSNL